jgi:hyperosmotically inducible protein
MLKRLAVVLSSAALCGAVGSASALAHEEPGLHANAALSSPAASAFQGQDVSDASVTTAVKTRLMKDKVARGTHIDVDTDDGVVTISGAVPTAADKARIGRLVRRTTGVKSVENKLTVSGAAAGTSGSGDTKIVIKDDTPDIKIKDDTNVKIKDDTTPKVKKGAKTVAKGAKEGAQAVAGAATSIAKKTADLTTDASVTTAVKTRLMKDDVARATAIDVSTDDGVVTIAGTVPTAADMARIGKLVADTTGVKRVVNHLKVGGQ